MTLVSEAEKFIKSVAEGVIICSASLMPFANQASCVTSILQGLGDGDFLRRQTKSGLFVERAGGIEFITETSRRTTGEQTCS